MSVPQVTLTRLIVEGARCEACSDTGTVAARFDGQIRYYCRQHVQLALRHLRLDEKRIR